MAPKRAALPDPPAASSSEEDDSDAETMDEDQPQTPNGVVLEKSQSDEEEEDPEEDEEEDDEEEEEEEKQPIAPNPESDPDSSSDTESDAVPPSPTASDFTVKPIFSVVKPRGPEPDPSPKKRRKTGSNAEEDDAKKGRLWGEDGEVAILEGMIDFKAKKGVDPSSNMTEFHEFLRGRLKADISRSQLSDKVKRLKKKYYNADDEAVFASGHAMKLAELAKRIWGRVEANGNGLVNDVGSSGSKKKSRKSKVEAEEYDSMSPVLALPVSYLPAKKSAMEKKEKKKKKKKTAAVVNYANGDVNVNLFENGGDASDENEEGFWSRYPHLRDSLEPGKRGGMEAHFKLSLPLIGNSKAKMLDARWRELQLLEAELVAKKMELQQEHANLMVNALKSRRD